MRAIDADALITELNRIRYPGAPYIDAGIRIAIGKVCDAPTIEEQKTGKWIHDGYDIPHGVDWMHCSVCGWREPYVPAAMTNYCPNCGADMRGKTNEKA